MAVRWTPLGRFGFRFAFCYLLIYAFACSGTLDLLPLIGRYLAAPDPGSSGADADG